MASPRSYRKAANTNNEITKPLSLVQQRARQFEALASLEVKSKACNWWLADFKHLKDDSCDCEQNDDLKPVVDGDDVASEEVVNDGEQNDNAEEIHKVVIEDGIEVLSVEELSIGGKEGPSEEEKVLTDDNDDETMDLPVKGKVIEAINNNVHFKGSPSKHHSIKLVHANDEGTLDSDEEYDSFTDDDLDDSLEVEEEDEEENDNKISDETALMENVSESKLANIIEELMDKEKTYIDKLTAGIQIYVEPLGGTNLPRSLRGQMYNIFANIVQIRDFHEQKFYPSLLACNGDVVALSDTFSMFIQNGYFYSYVLYAMNKKRSERLRDVPSNKAFFVDRQNEMADKLGVNSFLMEPIQRLPKYRLLIDQLAKVLSPFLEVEKTRLAACSRAEKNVQRLLNTVNESISLNDIIDCNEINLFHQGKFLRQNEFDVYDQETRRRYRGKVFLFERSVVFAEKLEEKVLHYRGNYPKDMSGIREYDEGRKFGLFIGKAGNRQIELNSSDFGLIQIWVNLVKEILVRSIEQEKRKIAKKMHDTRFRNSLRPTDVIVRKSAANYGSASASGSSWTGSSSSSGFSSKTVSLASNPYASGISNISAVSGYSTASADSDTARTTWYTDMEEHHKTSENTSNQKTTENLLTFEKHYVHQLSQFNKKELAELSDDLKFQIRTYLKVTADILQLHREQIYPDLHKCGQDIGPISSVFRRALESNSLHIYEQYTALVPRAYQVIVKFTGNKNFKHLMNLPVKHLKYYGSMLGKMLLELKESDQLKNIRDELKELALTDMEYSKFQKRCEANYNLNQLDPAIAEQYGLVVLTEKVTAGILDHTLLLLERGIVCVRSRLSSKTQEDKYTKRLFLIDRKCISFSSDKYPTAIKFYDICSRDVKYKVTFASSERKAKIIVEVNKIKSSF